MRLCLASNLQDEVENIQPIWDCLKDHVDSWLVVDSGSTDGTQDKLRAVVDPSRLTLIEDPMIKIYGYGYARTQLIELSQNADWVLIIDGDERMFPEEAARLRQIITTYNHYDMICLPRCHYQKWDMSEVEYGNMDTLGSDWKKAISINHDWQPRLVRRNMVNNKNQLVFTNLVHEQVISSTSKPLKILNDLTVPVIRHFGWMKTPSFHGRNNVRMKFISDLCDSLWKKQNGV